MIENSPEWEKELLCGGSCGRQLNAILGALSRALPKQVLKLAGQETLIQETIQRMKAATS
jgi:mannose-1-phosphate guanylyltransferase